MKTRLVTSGSLERYFEVMKEYPALFAASADRCLSIVTDRSVLEQEQEAMKRQSKLNGTPSHFYTLGVLFEDEWYIGLRDLVVFPDGKSGPYDRFVCKKGELAGTENAVVVPYCDEKVLVVRQFLHSTRKWHWITPRGFGESGADAAATARKELIEEAGLLASDVHPIFFNHENGSTIFLAKVIRDFQGPITEGKEVIDSRRWLTVPELECSALEGEITDSALLSSLVYLQRYGFPK